MIGRRETPRLAPKSFVFGLFEAIWDQNDLSHADVAPRGDSDAFAGTYHMSHAFDNVQPVTSDHSRTAMRVLKVARRRSSDIREPSKYRRAIKDASHRRLVPSWRTYGCKSARELVDPLPHGWTAG